jgi:hypothetical protein
MVKGHGTEGTKRSRIGSHRMIVTACIYSLSCELPLSSSKCYIQSTTDHPHDTIDRIDM